MEIEDQKMLIAYGKYIQSMDYVKTILNSDISSYEKFDTISVQVKDRKSLESRPFYIENTRFIKFMECADNYYNDNSHLLSKECQKYIVLPKGASMAILSVSVVCKMLNALKDNASISKTNLKVILSNSLLTMNYSVRDSKINACLLSNGKMLELGNFLYQGMVHASILEEMYGDHISLSEYSREILLISQAINLSHPSIVPYMLYSDGKKYYPYSINCDEDIYEMIHLNDSSGIRDSMTTIHDNGYSAINYSQSMAYTICVKTLCDVESDLCSEFREFCKLSKDSELLCFKYDNVEDLIGSQQDQYMSLVEKRMKIKLWDESNMSLLFFLHIVVTANIYSHRRLYFRNFYDWRGRLYIDGYPISPQGCKLSRKLLKFHGEERVVGLDVTASGFQIIGMLMGCEKTLKSTRFFHVREDVDIYEKSLSDFLSVICLKKEFSRYSPAFDRAFYKNLLMCFVYSETSYSRSKKIIDQILSICSIQIPFSVGLKLSKIIVECFNKENPKIFEFMEIMKDSARLINKNKKVMIFGTKSEFMKCVSVYAKQQTKRFSFVNFVDKKISKVSLRINKNPLQFCTLKNSSSIVPNFIHHLDSLILNKVLLECEKRHIKIFTVHDCFYVPEYHSNQIKEIYYECCELIFSRPQLKYFIEENELNDEILIDNYHEKFISLMEKYEMNRQILK